MDGLALRFRWGEHHLYNALLGEGRRRAFTVGAAAGVDFPCADVAGADAFVLVPPNEVRTVRFARGMEGTLWRADAPLSLREAVERGEAVPDADGYAVVLAPNDALELALGAVAVEAVPVRAPDLVPSAGLDTLDTRFVNVLVVVGFLACVGIVNAVGTDGLSYEDDTVLPAKHLAHFVMHPPPAPAPLKLRKARAESTQTPTRRPEVAPTPRQPDARQAVRQLSQSMGGLLGKGVLELGLSGALASLQSASVAATGTNGLQLKGGAGGCEGPGCSKSELYALGGIGRPGVGQRPGWSSAEGRLSKCKPGTGCGPVPELTDATPPTVVGMDRELIRQVIHQHRNELRYCYELELTRDPNLKGKTAVRFVISPSGQVSSSQVVESTVRSAQLETCVASRVRLWVFPKPPGGGQAIVTYPFVFQASSGAR